MRLDHWFCDRPALHEFNDDLRGQVARVERSIEAAGEAGQAIVGLFAVFQRVKRTSQCFLEVAENAVDPCELMKSAQRAGSRNHRNVNARRAGAHLEATQALAGYGWAWRQGSLRSLADYPRFEAADQTELGLERSTFASQRAGRHEWHLARGATANLAAGPVTTPVDIGKLNGAAQAKSSFLRSRDAVFFVAQWASREVVRSNLPPLECEGRQPVPTEQWSAPLHRGQPMPPVQRGNPTAPTAKMLRNLRNGKP